MRVTERVRGGPSAIPRRRFLAVAAAASGWVAAHRVEGLGMTEPGRGVRDAAAHIMALELRVGVGLDTMKRFYGRTLGLPILRDEPDRLDVRTGSSTIAFVPADGASDAPFYHFAFNIPENQILAARTWQLARTPLLPIPERLRDRAFPDDVVDYRHWNAHSIFFLDPAGNVVEYIARHDLDNSSRAPFGPDALLCTSEIGLVVDDVPAAAATLSTASGLPVYKQGSPEFTALGDEHGLLLVFRRGRVLNFQPGSQEKAARVYPTRARIRAGAPGRHTIQGYPYEVELASANSAAQP